MKAYLKNNRQAPRKVRLVADVIRGKQVAVALLELGVMSQKAAPVLKKLVASAFANAKHKDSSVKAEDLVVRSITVDKGMTYTRFMPRAFGRAAPINRESSHIRIELASVRELQAGATRKAVKKNNS
ncbi:MAG: 50S ribosomal protein L22 [Candidatus Pacebacteria bacterium]|nr:50S ribosomal protein L22 [Candidatus Paceibacterota bacterium]